MKRHIKLLSLLMFLALAISVAYTPTSIAFDSNISEAASNNPESVVPLTEDLAPFGHSYPISSNGGSLLTDLTTRAVGAFPTVIQREVTAAYFFVGIGCASRRSLAIDACFDLVFCIKGKAG